MASLFRSFGLTLIVLLCARGEAQRITDDTDIQPTPDASTQPPAPTRKHNGADTDTRLAASARKHSGADTST